ncbi:hypothetical protein L596_006868 [Steinernema carpocapsae]|uniref:Uncharacterized protein n=1 Tax=Steinernema carpocapsae TaxID=34508 RepID=A0A4U5P7B1_STECR|nr:hypothetical protein L596_006868 [Steinernema carpocapsae]
MERNRSPSASSDEWSVIDEDSIEYNCDSERSESDEEAPSEESIYLERENHVLEEAAISLPGSDSCEEELGSERDEDAGEKSEASMETLDEEQKADEEDSEGSVEVVEEEVATEVAEEAAESDSEVVEAESSLEVEVAAEAVENGPDSDAKFGLEVVEVESSSESDSEIVEREADSEEDREHSFVEEVDDDEPASDAQPEIEVPESESEDVEELDLDSTQEDEDEEVHTELESLGSESSGESSEESEDLVVLGEEELIEEAAARYFVNPEKAKDCFQRPSGISNSFVYGILGLTCLLLITVHFITPPRKVLEAPEVVSRSPFPNKLCDQYLTLLNSVYGIDGEPNIASLMRQSVLTDRTKTFDSETFEGTCPRHRPLFGPAKAMLEALKNQYDFLNPLCDLDRVTSKLSEKIQADLDAYLTDYIVCEKSKPVSTPEPEPKSLLEVHGSVLLKSLLEDLKVDASGWTDEEYIEFVKETVAEFEEKSYDVNSGFTALPKPLPYFRGELGKDLKQFLDAVNSGYSATSEYTSEETQSSATPMEDSADETENSDRKFEVFSEVGCTWTPIYKTQLWKRQAEYEEQLSATENTRVEEEVKAEVKPELNEKRNSESAEEKTEKPVNDWKEISDAAQNFTSILKRHVPKICKDLKTQMKSRLSQWRERFRAKKERIRSVFADFYQKAAPVQASLFAKMDRWLQDAKVHFKKATEDAVPLEENPETCHKSERPSETCKQESVIPSEEFTLPPFIPETPRASEPYDIPDPCSPLHRLVFGAGNECPDLTSVARVEDDLQWVKNKLANIRKVTIQYLENVFEPIPPRPLQTENLRVDPEPPKLCSKKPREAQRKILRAFERKHSSKPGPCVPKDRLHGAKMRFEERFYVSKTQKPCNPWSYDLRGQIRAQRRKEHSRDRGFPRADWTTQRARLRARFRKTKTGF